MAKYFLGIDIGTYESKGVIINDCAEIVTFTAESHTIINPQPNYFEHDAEGTWWGDFCKISNRLINDSGFDPREIGCVGFSTLGCDCLPVDKDNNPLYNAILYGIDCRSSEEISYLNKHYGEDAKEVFGHEICSSDISPKILWFKNNYPNIHQKAHKFLTGSSYLCAKLTGNYLIDKYLAEDFTPLYDLKANKIDPEACKLYCRPDQLAEIGYATDIAGILTESAAGQTGLAAGTPVLVGTGDSGSEAISTGVFRPGDIMVQLGSSAYIVYLSDHMVEEARLWPGTFIIPGVFSVCAGTNTAGTLTRWFRDEIYRELVADEENGGMDAYSAMVEDIKDIPAGSDGLICLPYFAGERTPINDPFAKGIFFGLQLSHSRAHLYKAAIEGIGYTIDQIFTVLRENNLPINKIMCVGGGTKNPVWIQTIADILGQDVYTAGITIGAAYGDAIMAALTGGAFSGWDELAEKVKPENTIHPNMDNHKHYMKNKSVFTQLYQNNKELMHLLS